jgi:hypothetical protein
MIIGRPTIPARILLGLTIVEICTVLAGLWYAGVWFLLFAGSNWKWFIEISVTCIILTGLEMIRIRFDGLSIGKTSFFFILITHSLIVAFILFFIYWPYPL